MIFLGRKEPAVLFLTTKVQVLWKNRIRCWTKIYLIFLFRHVETISSIIPNGTKVRLGLKLDKINVFTADGSVNLTKGVVNDVR